MPEFTVEQLGAIRYRQMDACVVAGPGSGKTTVLVERYRSLVEDEGFDPREILAITFTEKAAANMKAKLTARFAHNDARRREVEQAWVSTIHGFCSRLLHENAIAAGLDPRFTVLDARESEDLQFECMNEALDELVATRREEALRLIEALHTPAIAECLKEAYDAIRSAGVTLSAVRQMPRPGNPPTLLEAAAELEQVLRSRSATEKTTQAQRTRLDACAGWIEAVRAARNPDATELLRLVGSLELNFVGARDEHSLRLKTFRDERLAQAKCAVVDQLAVPFRALIFDTLDRFEEIYAARRREAAALDFNDLERHAIALLRNNAEVRERVRRQFRQVMLDEFQDINEQQEKLVELLRAENTFFAVGDINQSIYGFRHAEPGIFGAYRDRIEREGKHSARLFHNFRSRPEILRAAEALLNSASGIDPRDLVSAARFAPKQQPSVEILRVNADDAEEAALLEGKWLAHRIHQLRATLRITREDGSTRPAEFRDFAVLCRSREGMTPILEAFSGAGIPNVCGRRQSFLLSREGLDITALLRTLANPRDSVALATVLRSPLAGVSDESLLRLRLLNNSTSITSGLNMAAFDPACLAAFEAADAGKIAAFAAALKRWRAEQPLITLDLMIVRMLRDCGVSWIPGTREGDDIEAYLSLARTRGQGRTLLQFLRDIESMTGALTTDSDLSDEDQGNRVQVMTTHAAKGLEYPITIIAAMHKGVQRSSSSVTFTPAHGLGMKWSAPGAKDGFYDSWGNANKARIEIREEQEANRLLYVAMTRAREHLVLSSAYSGKQRGAWASKIDEFFDLKKRVPTGGFITLQAEGAEVGVLLVDSDPPPRLFAIEGANGRRLPDQIVPAAMLEQPETTATVTALNLFASCPRKYYLDRYLGWPAASARRFDPEIQLEDENREDDQSAADLGSEVHSLLAGKPGEYTAEASRLAAVFDRGKLGQRARLAVRSAREWDFIVEIEGTLVRGSIDLWFKDSEGIHLVDYKTDSLRPDEVSGRAAFYAPQLALYAAAVEKAFGPAPKSASLHFLRPDVIAEVPLTSALPLIAQLRAAQESFEFPFNEGPHCRTCRFHHASCPAA